MYMYLIYYHRYAMHCIAGRFDNTIASHGLFSNMEDLANILDKWMALLWPCMTMRCYWKHLIKDICLKPNYLFHVIIMLYHLHWNFQWTTSCSNNLHVLTPWELTVSSTLASETGTSFDFKLTINAISKIYNNYYGNRCTCIVKHAYNDHYIVDWEVVCWWVFGHFETCPSGLYR